MGLTLWTIGLHLTMYNTMFGVQGILIHLTLSPMKTTYPTSCYPISTLCLCILCIKPCKLCILCLFIAAKNFITLSIDILYYPHYLHTINTPTRTITVRRSHTKIFSYLWIFYDTGFALSFLGFFQKSLAIIGPTLDVYIDHYRIVSCSDHCHDCYW